MGKSHPSLLWMREDTLASNSVARRLTVDLEKELPHKASVTSLTFLTDTPWITISIKARTKACSLLW
jgi:hypothetical protein